MRRWSPVLTLCVLMLVSCGALTTQKLQFLLIQDGDLPAAYTAGQVSDGSVGPASRTNGFTRRVMREIQQAGRNVMPHPYAAVTVYRDEAALARDFGTVLPEVTSEGIDSSEVGEKARVRGNIVLFIRCGALAQVQFGDPNEVMTYAKRLDERLQSALC